RWRAGRIARSSRDCLRSGSSRGRGRGWRSRRAARGRRRGGRRRGAGGEGGRKGGRGGGRVFALSCRRGRWLVPIMKTGYISGTSILHSAVFAGWPERVVETPFGAVTLRERGGLVVLSRHGAGAAPLPPHAINHRANLRALADAG